MFCRLCVQSISRRATTIGRRSLSQANHFSSITCAHQQFPTISHNNNNKIQHSTINFINYRHYATASAQKRDKDSSASVEKHEFQAETRELLKIVATALYSRSEVFIRELISNGSDALEKLRYLQKVDPESLTIETRDTALEIRIETDPKANTITFIDNGIGMTKEALIENIGTIARSGTKAFMEELKANSKDANAVESVIGRFGCGFYSTFMVSHRVEIFTKSAQPNAKAYQWTSDGSSSYEISDAPDTTPIGTRIVVHLLPDEKKYADKKVVQNVIKQHSYYVNAPVIVDGERANSTQAIWTKQPSTVKQDEYESFFKLISHTGAERPFYTLHYKTDAPVSISAVLFVPDKRPQLLMPNAEANVELYSRRVLIQRDGKGIIPQWLRFVVGVIDSEDIPLNLSREMMQTGAVLDKLRSTITSRLVKYFEKEMASDRVRYQKFYENFGVHFKEAIISQQNLAEQDEISKLLLFDSSNCRPGAKVSLKEYVDRMQTNQTAIYYAHVPSRETAMENPFYEAMRQTNMEVLFVTDLIDEMVLFHLQKVGDKQITSAENWFKSQSPDKNKAEETEYKDLCQFIYMHLGPKRVEAVELTSRQIEQPCLITTAENESIMRTYGAMNNQLSEEHKIMLMRPKLTLNPKHVLIRRLNTMRRNEKQLAEELCEQLWVNAMVQAGLILDSRSRVSKLNHLLASLVERSATESGILTPGGVKKDSKILT